MKLKLVEPIKENGSTETREPTDSQQAPSNNKRKVRPSSF